MSIAQKTVDVLLDSDLESDDLANDVYTSAMTAEADKMFKIGTDILFPPDDHQFNPKFKNGMSWCDFIDEVGIRERYGPMGYSMASLVAKEAWNVHKGKSVDSAWDDVVKYPLIRKMNLQPRYVDLIKRLLSAIPLDPWTTQSEDGQEDSEP